MCILQQVRYSTVEYNFVIECDVCIGKISVFVKNGLKTLKMIVLEADVGWYVNNLACNAGEISDLFISRMVFA